MRDTAKCNRGGGIKGSFEEKGVLKGNHENPLLGAIGLRLLLFYAERAKSSL